MTVVDWAETRSLVPTDRPCRVWLPEPREPEPAARTRTSAARRPAHAVALTLTPVQAKDLTRGLPHLLAGVDLGPGDQVAVDLGECASVQLSGLSLLLTMLWRRVGPHGEVTITGGTPGLRAQLISVGITPGQCRAAAYEPARGAPVTTAPVPAPASPSGLVGPATVPGPPGAPDARGDAEEDTSRACLVLAGEVNLTVDLRTQARLNELVERRPRTLEVDVSQVSWLSLSSLRLLLAADARLRARGGRVLLRNPTPPVSRLLAVTKATWLTDDRPGAAAVAASTGGQDDTRGQETGARGRRATSEPEPAAPRGGTRCTAHARSCGSQCRRETVDGSPGR